MISTAVQERNRSNVPELKELKSYSMAGLTECHRVTWTEDGKGEL